MAEEHDGSGANEGGMDGGIDRSILAAVEGVTFLSNVTPTLRPNNASGMHCCFRPAVSASRRQPTGRVSRGERAMDSIDLL